ncbi:MAG: hypothetical protein EXS48_02530 [Candidatus Staskawiczbacteria bacterium]|nr:hypothetical protein [Candidatus Staskawiczbacteria bacterium]
MAERNAELEVDGGTGGGPKIELPKDDPELVGKLRTKLEEYKVRLVEKERKIDIYKSPQQRKEITASTRYKVAVLQEVIDNGSVDTQELSNRLAVEDGIFSLEDFENACSVIDSYCRGEAEKNRGGTGLK